MLGGVRGAPEQEKKVLCDGEREKSAADGGEELRFRAVLVARLNCSLGDDEPLPFAGWRSLLSPV